MFQPVLLAVFLFLQQKPAPTKAPELGIIAGNVAAPEKAPITRPLQVLLLPPEYADLFNADVQKRLDAYWERYKPAFAQKKEFFLDVSRMAEQESLQFIVSRMQRDLGSEISRYRIQSSPEGKFEFRNLPLGEYKVIASGRAGDQEYIWQESINVTSSVPQFLQLKHRVP
jgi:hypothetical protein